MSDYFAVAKIVTKSKAGLKRPIMEADTPTQATAPQPTTATEDDRHRSPAIREFGVSITENNSDVPMKIYALCDTGADLNIASRKLGQTLIDAGAEIVDTQVTCLIANGESMTSWKVIRIWLHSRLDDRPVKAKVTLCIFDIEGHAALMVSTPYLTPDWWYCRYKTSPNLTGRMVNGQQRRTRHPTYYNTTAPIRS